MKDPNDKYTDEMFAMHTTNPLLRYLREIQFTGIFYYAADGVAEGRDICNEGRMRYRAAEIAKVGKVKHRRMTENGALGEQIVGEYLLLAGIKFKMAKMVARDPIVGPDFFLYELRKRADAKFIGWHNTDFLIGGDSHDKRKCDIYLGAYVPVDGSTTALIFEATWDEVELWPLKTIYGNPVRYMPRKVLDFLVAQARKKAG